MEGDALVVGVMRGQALSGSARLVNERTGGLLTRLIETEEIKGDLGECKTLYGPAQMAVRQVVVVGLGNPDGFGRGRPSRRPERQ